MPVYKARVSRKIFVSQETGFGVFLARLEGARESRVIVGNLHALSVGDLLEIEGEESEHPRFGRQIKVSRFEFVKPQDAEGIVRYLASGRFKGIGRKTAQRIADHFGPTTFEVLENQPERLREVPGLKKTAVAAIQESVRGSRALRDLTVRLTPFGVGQETVYRIHREFGDLAMAMVEGDPYQLIERIRGVGFKVADAIARAVGVARTDPQRLRAGILFHLQQAEFQRGDLFVPRDELLQKCAWLLDVDDADVFAVLQRLLERGELRLVELPEPCVLTPQNELIETAAAQRLRRLARDGGAAEEPAVNFASVFATLALELTEEQKQAVLAAVRNRLTVITGGPGTGKTTIIRAIIEVLRANRRPVLVAAPTGRAAKRLSETTGREAKTIHRTLEFNPKTGKFRRDPGRPLQGDAIIIDEFSMVDLALMHGLVRAIPAAMRLILVGDKDQLPALGPGTLLRDLIECGRVNVVRLDEIFRQEQDSLIVVNAHRINQGLGIVHPKKGDAESDFYFIRAEEEAKVFSTIMQLCGYRIPQRFHLSPLSPQIQVISPMYKGFVGVERLNTEMQARLNASGEALHLGARQIRVRDKVMQIRNNYEKDVFNGDIGTVVHVDPARFGLIVHFDGRPVFYERDDLDDLVLAYAVSVHKSQGSEYQAVVLPLLTQHFIMLQRNLFYTALTRAKRLSVVIGSYKALYIAIKNDKPVQRNSLIKEKLLAALDAPDRDLT